MFKLHKFSWYWNRARAYVGRPRMIVQTKPVVIDDSDYCEEPIFMVGAHRSGTSLVRRLFNSHSQIACPPESFFISHYAAMFQDRHIGAGYEAFGYSDEDRRRDLARNASRLHEAYRLATGKQIWADKTPIYALHLDAIDALYGGKPRYVLVLRHPGDIVFSIHNRNWRFNDVEDGFESALAHVKETIDAMMAFEARHPERCVRIVYGELCSTPETVLESALHGLGLGLRFEPGMLNFADQDHNFGLEDPVVRGTRAIKAQSGSWRGLEPHRQARIAEVFGDWVDSNLDWRDPIA